MATELETGLPSVRQVQALIRDKKEVEIKLLTGDQLIGKAMWQDPHCVCLQNSDGESLIIWQQAIAYIKPKS